MKNKLIVPRVIVLCLQLLLFVSIFSFASVADDASTAQLSSSETLNLDMDKVKMFESIIKEDSNFLNRNPIRYAESPEGRKIITDCHHRVRAAIAAKLDKIPVVEAKPWEYPMWNGDPSLRLTFSEVDDAAREYAKVVGRKW